MKKIVLSILVLSCLAFGQEKSKIAVYLTGSGDPDNDKMLSIMLLDGIVKEYPYYFIAIDRNEAFLAQMDKEHVKQRSGAINETQITELGKQAGVDYLCIGDITKAFGSYMLNARINNQKTAQVVATGRGSSKTLEEIEVVEDLLSQVVKSMGKDLLRNFK
ncbi:MAG: hypothetical protein LBB56_06435 [Chitinispirillales bacterium]|jgi:TolB-like protein|nr:hypothetical protein [Chitinispirillales bacterium]